MAPISYVCDYVKKQCYKYIKQICSGLQLLWKPVDKTSHHDIMMSWQQYHPLETLITKLIENSFVRSVNKCTCIYVAVVTVISCHAITRVTKTICYHFICPPLLMCYRVATSLATTLCIYISKLALHGCYDAYNRFHDDRCLALACCHGIISIATVYCLSVVRKTSCFCCCITEMAFYCCQGIARFTFFCCYQVASAALVTITTIG